MVHSVLYLIERLYDRLRKKKFSDKFHKEKSRKDVGWIFMKGFNFSAWKLSSFKYFNATLEHFLCC